MEGKVIPGGRGGFITPREAKAREIRKANPTAYTSQEARIWLRRLRNDYWWQTEMPLTWDALDNVIGKIVFNGGKSECMTDNSFRQLANVIDPIENRIVCFPIRKLNNLNNMTGGDRNARRRPILVYPEVLNREISKLSLFSSWSLHARCLSCKGNKFLPVRIDGREHVACYCCIPPSQYKTIRAVSLKVKLIDEELKKYY